jgi:membrane protease subunit HflK
MRKVLLFICVLVLVGYGLTGVVQVRPGERAVVRRFGRVLADKPEPGLWVGLPWGMDRVDRVVVDQVRQVVVGYQDEESGDGGLPSGQLLTGDDNLVNVQVVLSYTVRPDEVADFVVHQGRVDDLLARAVEAGMAEWVAGRNVDEVLLRGKTSLRDDMLRRLPERLMSYGLGVEVRDVRVALIAPPDEVKAAFDGVARAQTQMATVLNRAQQDAQRDLRRAQADVYGTEQATAAHVEASKVLAQREAEHFLVRLKEYQLGRRRNPDYLRQLWQEERTRLFQKLKEKGQLDLLDHYLGADGLDLHTMPGLPRKE